MIEVLIDVASPNAYLADKALRARGAPVRYTPILLGGLFKLTGNSAPMIAYGGVPNKLAYEMRELGRFVEAHGLTAYRMNPHFPVNSLLAMRAATGVARTAPDALAGLLDVLLAAMWERGENLSDEDVLSVAIERAGLDAEAVMTSAQAPETKDALKTATQNAADRGAFGVPTFFVGDDMWFGKERLDAVMAAA